MKYLAILIALAAIVTACVFTDRWFIQQKAQPQPAKASTQLTDTPKAPPKTDMAIQKVDMPEFISPDKLANQKGFSKVPLGENEKLTVYLRISIDGKVSQKYSRKTQHFPGTRDLHHPLFVGMTLYDPNTLLPPEMKGNKYLFKLFIGVAASPIWIEYNGERSGSSHSYATSTPPPGRDEVISLGTWSIDTLGKKRHDPKTNTTSQGILPGIQAELFVKREPMTQKEIDYRNDPKRSGGCGLQTAIPFSEDDLPKFLPRQDL